MKIIVTGALGHIGSKLFLQLGDKFPDTQIILIDNLSTQRYCSLYNLPNKQFKFIEGDLLHLDLSRYISNGDVVIHLAAITDATASVNNAKVVMNNNYNTTLRVAKSCILKNAYLFYPSSTSVYGSQDSVMLESTPLSDLNPQSPYAESKIAEEKLLQKLSLEQSLQVTIARFGTIYGTSPGMRFHTAINKFCWQSVLKQPLTVWQTAFKQKRPYLDLEDAVNLIVHVIENKIFNKHIYNVATSNNTVEDITNIIKKYIPGLVIDFVPHKIMNQLSYVIDTKKIQDTGFIFNGNLEAGIKKTLDRLSNCNI